MINELIGKRVFLVNPGGYPAYAGTVRGRWKPFEGSTVYDEWADVDWDVKVHPCTTPIETKHLVLAPPGYPKFPAPQQCAIVDVAWRRVEFIGTHEECDDFVRAHPERFMQTGSRNFIRVLMP